MKRFGNYKAPMPYPKPSEAAEEAHEAFIAHIMSAEARLTNCCCAPIGRYCEVGARLNAEHDRLSRV
jgi:hypothetical protein